MTDYPKTVTLKIELEITVPDSESEAYFLAEEDTLSHKFLADLFDIFEYEGSIGIERINTLSKNQVQRALQNQNQ